MWWGVVLLWMAGIWYLSAQPDLRSSFEQDFLLRKIAHVLVFGGLTYVVTKAWAASGWRQSSAAAALWSLAYAMIDEWHQSYVPGRHGSPVDVAIDAIGIVVVAGFFLYTKHRPARAMTKSVE